MKYNYVNSFFLHRIINTKFKNCHTPYGYLINTKTSTTTAKNNWNIIIENCDFNGIKFIKLICIIIYVSI